MKKGFTLVELMAVLVILALLALIVTPNILASISKYNKGIYDTQVDNIIGAAKNWAADMLDDRGCLICVTDSEYVVSGKDCATLGGEGCKEAPLGSNATTRVTLKQLQDGGYIKENVKNTKTDANFASCVTVVISKDASTNDYKYEITNPDALESSC